MQPAGKTILTIAIDAIDISKGTYVCIIIPVLILYISFITMNYLYHFCFNQSNDVTITAYWHICSCCTEYIYVCLPIVQ